MYVYMYVNYSVLLVPGDPLSSERGKPNNE